MRTDNERLKLTRNVVQCITSLNEAMESAGGKSLSVEELDSMSVMKFISLIAPNNIQFVHRKDPDVLCAICGQINQHSDMCDNVCLICGGFKGHEPWCTRN